MEEARLRTQRSKQGSRQYDRPPVSRSYARGLPPVHLRASWR